MLVFTFLMVIIGAFVNAMPIAPNGDGRGATIWNSQDFAGTTTFIPGNAGWCTDLNNIVGNFDGKVRSLSVEIGYKCQFFTSYGCPANGKKLDLGSTSQRLEQSKLPVDFDLKIHSVYCAPLRESQ